MKVHTVTISIDRCKPIRLRCGDISIKVASLEKFHEGTGTPMSIDMSLTLTVKPLYLQRHGKGWWLFKLTRGVGRFLADIKSELEAVKCSRD